MRKSKIIERGRLALESDICRELLRPAGDYPSLSETEAAGKQAEARVALMSTKKLYLAGQIAVGRAEIRRRNFDSKRARGGFSDSRDTAAAMADRAESMATDGEALTAFKKQQTENRVATAMGATLVAVGVAAAIWYGHAHAESVNDRPLQPEITDAPFPNYSEDQDMKYQMDMNGIYGNDNDREMALPPIITSTPVPPATPLYS